jgi:putative phosphoribosyl transferase
MRFADRATAGRLLAAQLAERMQQSDVVVLGLPRGGVPVAREVSDRLGATLDVFVVRKLGLPGHRELAVGAIASGGVQVLNQHVLDRHYVDAAAIDQVVAEETAELERRERVYRGDRPAPDLRDRPVVIVDDGLATGATMRAAAVAVRRLGAAVVVCAAPVAPPNAPQLLADVADDVVAVLMPADFSAVGQFYDDFRPTTDDEVRAALAVPS